MSSIRRSLVGYVLVLLALTLGLAAVVVDRIVENALTVREQAEADRIRVEFDSRRRDEQARVDNVLLQQARETGRAMRAQYNARMRLDVERFRTAVAISEEVARAGGQPTVAVGWAMAMQFPSPVVGRIARGYFSHLSLEAQEEVFARHADEEPADMLQVSNYFGAVWRSRGLEPRTLPLEKSFDAMTEFEPRFDDAELTESGVRVRRVAIKMPLLDPFSRFGGRGSGSSRRGPSSGNQNASPPTGGQTAGVGPPPPPPPSSRPPAGPPPAWPSIVVQVAREQEAIDSVLRRLADERDNQVATLAAQTRAERRELRLQLGGLGLAVFAAVAVGGTTLIRRGLLPLRRLSDAVSQVSEKDFSLPVDGSGMPRELAGIHGRLTGTLDQLREAFAREKRAVADISHELRTPIASLLATLDVSLRKQRPAESYRATLEECRAIAKQLGALVERIMTLAWLDAGAARAARKSVDAADLAGDCAAVIRPLAAANGLALGVDVPATLTVDTDPDQLREVLMNLLHNAVEYNRPGGRVDLCGRREGGRVVLEVRDTGIGMPPDVRTRIFERFYRADPSRHATGVHAGLGLSIVKEYVDRLGGRIGVESEPGVGSRFRVELPARAPGDTAA